MRVEVVEHLLGVGVVAGDGVADDLAVVGGRVERLLRHGVDDVGGDEVDDVHRVAVGRVLDAGGGPQRTLRAGALGLEGLPARGREDLLEGLVGQPRVGHAGLALEGLGLVGADRVEPLVDLGVDAGDEERGDRVDLRQVLAGRVGLLEAVEVGVHHRAVALEGEDQRDVDADPVGDGGRDGGQAVHGGGDLDEHVVAVDGVAQRLGLGDGAARCRGPGAGRPRSRPGRRRRRSRRRAA